MKEIIKDFIELLILFGFFLTLFIYNIESNKKILKEIKEMRSTLEYIDKRMDTLEFYRVPEQYKK